MKTYKDWAAELEITHDDETDVRCIATAGNEIFFRCDEEVMDMIKGEITERDGNCPSLIDMWDHVVTTVRVNCDRLNRWDSKPPLKKYKVILEVSAVNMEQASEKLTEMVENLEYTMDECV